MSVVELPIQTERLVLRSWKESDLEPFAAMNRDSRVMEFLPKPLTRAESVQLVDKIRSAMSASGFGLWAVETRRSGEFIGYVGLLAANFEAHFTPCVEVGWRLAHRFWGCGYATEAARKALSIGFTAFGLDAIVSFTVPRNVRSRKVMERLGMTHDPADDFNHPKLESGHPLERHVLYRLSKDDWMRFNAPR